MSVSASIISINESAGALTNIQDGQVFEYVLLDPSPESKERLKNIVQEFLKKINLEKSYNLLCLCLE